MPDPHRIGTVRLCCRYGTSAWVHDIPDTSLYSVTEGNLSCDCNRVALLGLTPEEHPGLYHLQGSFYGDGSGPVDETHPRCGEHIQTITAEYIDA